MILSAMTSPAARELGLNDLGPVSDRGKGRLDRVRGAQMHPMLGGIVEERQQLLRIVGGAQASIRRTRTIASISDGEPSFPLSWLP
jgi:hypothetical protein